MGVRIGRPRGVSDRFILRLDSLARSSSRSLKSLRASLDSLTARDLGADEKRSEVLGELQLRAVGLSIAASLAVIGVVLVYVLAPGHYPLNTAALLAVVAVSAATLVACTRVPWRTLVEKQVFVPAFFAWALVEVGLVSIGVALSGGSHSELYLLYLAMCVFMVGVPYPRPARLSLAAVLVAAYVLALVGAGWSIGTATVLFRLGTIAVTAGAADVMAVALTKELYAREQTKRLSDERASMWSRVAGLGRQAGSLDENEVLAWAVDAVREVGFEAANVCMFTDGGQSYRVVQARGLPDEYVRQVQSSDRGMASLVREERRTVVVGDYNERPDGIPLLVASGFQTVVATPVWVEGELAGALVGGTRDRRPVEAEEIAAIELLAAHAGHGVETARTLENQSRDAAHFRSLITSAPDAMVVMDTHGEILEANDQVGRLFGYQPMELVGMNISSLMPERGGRFSALFEETFSRNPRTLVLGDAEEVCGTRKDGSSFPMEMVLGPIDAPEGLLVTATVRDVTERKEFERRLAHQATHDHLTGLPNRSQFVGRLAEALDRTMPGTFQVAVLFLDVDHFKYVNDSRGHNTGDQLVMEVSRRIASTARAGDFVARFGGDEFAVLVESLGDRQGAIAYAWRLLSSFDRPFLLDGVECYLSASVGIAFGVRGDNPHDLLRNADAAMYHAKQRGRARVEIFDDTLTARAVERLEIESALHQALLGEQLSLVYQSVVELSDRTVTGVEALLRWQHPERGAVPPLAFVPIAEESGLILQIGRWVLNRACQHASGWSKQLPGSAFVDNFGVSVNVSNRQLEHDRLIAEVSSVLESTRLPPSWLVVEITESFFMRDLQAAVRRLRALKQLGVRIAIDDFGTGFSSLNSLARLPIDIVKIDKTFTDSLGTRNDAIIAAVVEVADAFGLAVVAEGVESENQRERLIGLGCRYGQGFLFGRPIPSVGMERVLLSHATAHN